MTKRKFFIDTDTASDDAVALLMALEYPDVEVLGVSIVSGNMPVEQGSINARYTIELCEKEVPVYVGRNSKWSKLSILCLYLCDVSKYLMSANPSSKYSPLRMYVSSIYLKKWCWFE